MQQLSNLPVVSTGGIVASWRICALPVTVLHACVQSGRVSSDSQPCHPMTLLATICDREMENMGGCSTYVTMCGDDSRVHQCNQHPRIRRYWQDACVPDG